MRAEIHDHPTDPARRVVRDERGEVVAIVTASQRPETALDVGAIGNDLRNALMVLDHGWLGTRGGSPPAESFVTYHGETVAAVRRGIVAALEKIEGPHHVPVPPTAPEGAGV